MAGLSEAEKLNGIVTGVKDHYNEIVKNESASGGESIKPFCVDGAIMQCTMGSAPGKLTVIDHGVAITGKYAAHDEDRVPGTNIPSFGTCAATGKPCAPSPVPKWLLTDEFSLMTNKRGAAATSAENCALITDSILVCMQGGIIKFVTSGQMMTVGDLLEMLKALFEAMQKGGGGTGNEGKKPAFTGDDGLQGGKTPSPMGLDAFLERNWPYLANGMYSNTPVSDEIFDAVLAYPKDGIGLLSSSDFDDVLVARIIASYIFHEAGTYDDMDRLARLVLNRWILGGYPNFNNIKESENEWTLNKLGIMMRSPGGTEVFSKENNNEFNSLVYKYPRDTIKNKILSGETVQLSIKNPYDLNISADIERWSAEWCRKNGQEKEAKRHEENAAEFDRWKDRAAYLAKVICVSVGLNTDKNGLANTSQEGWEKQARRTFNAYVENKFPETGLLNGELIKINPDYVTWQVSSTSNTSREFIFIDEQSNKYGLDSNHFDYSVKKYGYRDYYTGEWTYTDDL